MRAKDSGCQLSGVCAALDEKTRNPHVCQLPPGHEGPHDWESGRSQPADIRMCDHPDFAAEVDVNRLSDSGRFQADVRIRCSKCGTPFRFIGLPAGIDLEGAATSVGGTEARLAIAPKGEVLSVLEGAPIGFTVRRSQAQ